MSRIRQIFIAILAAGAVSALVVPAYAQFPGGPVGQKRDRPPARTGDISISDVSGSGTSNYTAAQQQAFEFVKALFQFVSDAKSGNVTRPPTPDDKVLWYLGGVYLYCVIEEGSCPHLLDMILEVDVANSRLAKNPSCPVMVSFWKSYLQNGLEDRHKYATKTGYLSTTVEFNQRVRPKYVKCEQTVRGEISGANSDAEFFSLRYRQGTGKVEGLARSLKFLEAVKAQIPNVFIQTGAIKESDQRRRRRVE